MLDSKFNDNPYFLLILKFPKVLDGPSLTHSHATPSKFFFTRSKSFLKVFCHFARSLETSPASLYTFSRVYAADFEEVLTHLKTFGFLVFSGGIK